MSFYHCLVLTRPGGVPQLRALNCENHAEMDPAVAQVLAEWREVVSVEVFCDSQSVKIFDADMLKAMKA